MFENVHHVYYNSNKDQRTGFELHCIHETVDEQFIQFLKSEIQDDNPIVILNAKATMPVHWQTRLLQPMAENDVINWISALTVSQYELSPIVKPFSGSLAQLDQAVYLLQEPAFFMTSIINKHCFAVRSIEFIDKHPQYFAVNNLLVDAPTNSPDINPSPAPEIGDQHPLPAHPLSKLQFQISCQPSEQTPVDGYPGLDQKPAVLHVVMDWGGGVHQWTNDFIQSHSEMNHLVLMSQGEYFRQQQGEQFKLLWQGTDGLKLAEFHLSLPVKATIEHHQHYQLFLDQVLAQWDVQMLVVSTLIGHSMDCLRTGLPTLRILHDYFPHWPSLNAQLDENVIDESQLKAAIDNSLNEPFGHIDQAQLTQWQKITNQLLLQANINIIAPDESVKTNLLKLAYSDCYKKAQIIPHGVNPVKAIPYQAENNPFKVLVLGRVSPAKGQALLKQCIETLKGDKSIQIVLLGAGIHGKEFKSFPNTVVIENYDQKDLHHHLAKISPQLGLLASVTSETFGYTLSELQMAGIPSIATAVGALKNRIIDGENGFLVNSKAQNIVAKIKDLQKQSKQLLACREQIIGLPVMSLAKNKEAYDHIIQTMPLSISKYQQPELLTPSAMAHTLQKEILNADSLAQHIEEAESRVKDREIWAQDLSKHNQHLTNNIELERQENKKLKQGVLQQSEKVKELESDIKELHQHVKKINTELSETLSLRDELSQRLEVSNNELHLANNQIEQIKSSRSWRFTRPLRNATTYIRHKRNALRFRFNQLKNLPKRLSGSLKNRGFKQTAQMAKNKLKKPEKSQDVLANDVAETFGPINLKTKADHVVSVIIPVYNHYKHTHHCLQSLAKLKDNTPFEVWVIDDCSDDETQDQIKHVTGINYHRQEINGGFIASCNTGAELATGEYLLFLNNDTEVLDGWLDELVHTFATQADAGLVGSQLLYPDGRLQEAGGIVFNDASGWNYGRLDSPDNPAFQHLRQTTYISGASIMIKAALFKQLGYFDSRYKPAYYEDTDLAFSIRKAGKKVYYQPLSRVIHFEGISSGTDINSGTKKYQVINQKKFLEKWQNELKTQPTPGSDIELARFQNHPPRVLIFDACTPTPDQDSGSLRMMNLMKIFIELGHQVSFIPENMAHFNNYTTDLQRLGVECIYAPRYSSPISYLKEKGSYFQTVILSRYYVAEPVMPMIRSYCPDASIWFDTVDLHYLRETRMAELANNPTAIKAAETTKQKELAVAQNCDLTLVVSPYEQQVLAAEKTHSDVAVLSNIHEVYGGHQGFHKSKDLLFIGGYQHTPNVDGVLWFVNEIFPKICAEHPDIVLHVVGSKAPQEVIDLGQHPNINFHGYVEDIEPLMQNIRIAVAPLRFGAGVKGKVNMSMSYGQPVVGTKVAVEGMYTTNAVDVMMADSADEFAGAVNKLYLDQALWEQVSKGGLENVQKWFSFTAAKNSIATLLGKY